MNTLNENYHNAEVDPDEERINRLIAKYTNIRESNVKREDEDFEVDKLCDFSATSWQNYTSMQTYPMRIDRGYIYKVCNTDSNPEDVTHSTCDINLDGFYDSDYNFSKNMDQQTSKDILGKKSFAEKTTYCRPINKKLTTNFVHQVMETNSKLQLLLTKIVIARQKEKEKDKWDSYVKNLMMKKHSYREQSMQFSSTMPKENINPLLLKELSNNKNKLTQSDSYREILNDLYSDRNELFLENNSEQDERNNPSTSFSKNQVHWFPSTSNTLQVNKTFREKNKSKCHHYRDFGTTIVVSSEDISPNKTLKLNRAKINRDEDVQTNVTFGNNKNIEICLNDELVAELQAQFSEQLVTVIDKSESHDKNKSKKEYYDRLAESFQALNDKNEPNYENKSKKEYYDRLVQSFHELEEIQQTITQESNTSDNIEDKLDTLINLFNNFILEFKPKENLKPKESSKSIYDNNENEAILDSPETSASKGKKRKKKVTIVGNVMTNTSLCVFEALSAPKQVLNSRHEKILCEELKKNNQLRNEIEAMLNPAPCRPCRLRINIDVPTRERSTEVTNSLSKTELVKTVKTPERAIVHTGPRSVTERQGDVKPESCDAMNTDPVGLLAMLRFSTEAIKQILSFMPSVNRWYLSTDPPISNGHYVCNVCGLTFVRPSQLSAHILGHDLGQAKERRAKGIALAAEAQSPFKCEFCEQQFSRAYCYEFHRRNCARRLDRPRDSSTLVMLR